MASPYIHTNCPIQLLDCSKAWSLLTIQEKLYAYYFSRASLEGSKVCYFQRSVESPGLFLIFQELFSVTGLEKKVREAGLLDEDWIRFKAFAAGVYNNSGNYRSFGDSKILPEIEKEKFETILNLVASERIDRIWDKIGSLVYDSSPEKASLNFVDKGGVTSYYSQNIQSSDAEFVKEFLMSKNLTDVHVNSRLWKTGETYEIKIASDLNQFLAYVGEYEYKGKTIKITNGDYHIFMKRIVDNLSRALPYTSNETQEKMLIHYIRHFLNGDIHEHKNSQKE